MANPVILQLHFTREEMKNILDCITYNQEIIPSIRIKIYKLAISRIKILSTNKSNSLFTCIIIKDIIYSMCNILSKPIMHIDSDTLNILFPEFNKDNCTKLAIKNKWKKEYIPLDGCAWFLDDKAKPRIMFLNWCIKAANANNNNNSTSISSSTGVQ